MSYYCCYYYYYPDCFDIHRLDMVLDTTDWVSNQYPKSATRPMHSDVQTVMDEYRIDDMDVHMVPCDKVQYSLMPFYAPFSISFVGSGTKSLSASQLSTMHEQFLSSSCVLGIGWNGILSLILAFDNGCRMFVGV